MRKGETNAFSQGVNLQSIQDVRAAFCPRTARRTARRRDARNVEIEQQEFRFWRMWKRDIQDFKMPPLSIADNSMFSNVSKSLVFK